MENDAVRTILTRTLRTRTRAHALNAALRVCTPREAEPLIAALLDIRGKGAARDALAGAARNWGKLSGNLRKRVVARAGDLDTLIAGLAASADPHAREAACGLVTESLAPASLTLLGRLLVDDATIVRDAAANALHVVETAAERSEDVRVGFDRLLALGASTFTDHRRRDVMDMIVRRLDQPGPALRAWLRSPDEAGLMGLRAAIRRSRGRGVALRAFGMAAHPTLGGAFTETLNATLSDDEREAVLSRRALLARDMRRTRLARSPTAGAILGDAESISGMREAARHGAISLVRVATMDEDERIARLAARLNDAEPAVRLAAARAVADARPCVRRGEDGAREGLLSDFSHDADGRVARCAATAMACGRDAAAPVRRRVLSALLRSKHAHVRAVAAATLDGVDPWRNPASARLWLARDRDGFVQALRDRVARTPGGHDRTSAIALAVRLRLVHEVELELLGAACATDVRAAAAATSALGRADSDASRTALVRLCAHSDARVRANAVDALGARGVAGDAVLAAFNDPSPRCVAAAIVATARARGSDARNITNDAASLLRHGAESARAAGLWATERAGLTALSEDVCAILHAPISDEERRRAARCARALLRRMNSDTTHAGGDAVSNEPVSGGAPRSRGAGERAHSAAPPEVVVRINAREMAW